MFLLLIIVPLAFAECTDSVNIDLLFGPLIELAKADSNEAQSEFFQYVNECTNTLLECHSTPAYKSNRRYLKCKEIIRHIKSPSFVIQFLKNKKLSSPASVLDFLQERSKYSIEYLNALWPFITYTHYSAPSELAYWENELKIIVFRINRYIVRNVEICIGYLKSATHNPSRPDIRAYIINVLSSNQYPDLTSSYSSINHILRSPVLPHNWLFLMSFLLYVDLSKFVKNRISNEIKMSTIPNNVNFYSQSSIFWSNMNYLFSKNWNQPMWYNYVRDNASIDENIELMAYIGYWRCKVDRNCALNPANPLKKAVDTKDLDNIAITYKLLKDSGDFDTRFALLKLNDIKTPWKHRKWYRLRLRSYCRTYDLIAMAHHNIDKSFTFDLKSDKLFKLAIKHSEMELALRLSFCFERDTVMYLLDATECEDAKFKHKFINLLDSDFFCSICQSDISGAQELTKCYHWYHTECLDRYVEVFGRAKCPLCKELAFRSN